MSRQGFETTVTSALPWCKPPDPVLLERLAETGFLATELGMHEQAERIFCCLATLTPERAEPLVALAMVHARRGWMEQAIGELRDLLEQRPDCDVAKAVLGTMLIHVGRPGALQLFEEVRERSCDVGALRIVESCMDSARQVYGAGAVVAANTCQYFLHCNVRP